ncbi:MAG: sigma-70 family RNA polymerase sigma factor [Acidimicrobiia bacterium]|nr:sigma-70 family RNA polymerase sigma factor [Acidimicrobiia bacterium]
MGTVPSSDERFRTLYEEHYADIRSYCLRRLPVDAAADAASEIFTIAWRKLDSVPDGAQARPWLFTVARNVVANQRRSKVRAHRLRSKAEYAEEPPVDSAVESVVVRNAEYQAALDALSRLKPIDQELLRLRIWEDLSHAEIGEVLGISSHAVTMRLKRATGRLAKLLTVKSRVRPHPIAEGGES